ncbi:hypothetical protein QBC41DRAFT_302073 [Cercophora samala]|uniref:Uncharacterized protein n=1 Tax=Cercophora samala TaxID=330535 RepID=A0AA39ZFB9_9PEZI|nr:hypothetical protein QBC41DRAFT_302073 [Cercophora samala]
MYSLRSMRSRPSEGSTTTSALSQTTTNTTRDNPSAQKPGTNKRKRVAETESEDNDDVLLEGTKQRLKLEHQDDAAQLGETSPSVLATKLQELKEKLNAMEEQLTAKDLVILAANQEKQRMDELLQDKETRLQQELLSIESLRDSNQRVNNMCEGVISRNQLAYQRQTGDLQAAKETIKKQVQDLGAANNTIIGLKSEVMVLQSKKRDEMKQAVERIARMEKEFERSSALKDQQLAAANSTTAELKQHQLDLSKTRDELTNTTKYLFDALKSNGELVKANDSLKKTRTTLQQVSQSNNLELNYLVSTLCGLVTKLDVPARDWGNFLQCNNYRMIQYAIRGSLVGSRWRVDPAWPIRRESQAEIPETEYPKFDNDEVLILSLCAISRGDDLSTSKRALDLLRKLIEVLSTATLARIPIIKTVISDLCDKCTKKTSTELSALQAAFLLLQLDEIIRLRWAEMCGIKERLVEWMVSNNPSLETLCSTIEDQGHLLDVCEKIGYVFRCNGGEDEPSSLEERGADYGVIPVAGSGGFFMARWDSRGTQHLWAIAGERVRFEEVGDDRYMLLHIDASDTKHENICIWLDSVDREEVERMLMGQTSAVVM